MKSFLRILIITFLIFPAFVSAQMMSNLVISGNISNTMAPMIYLSELEDGSMAMVDSASIDAEGNFQFNSNIKGANFFQLTTGGQQYTILILEPNDHIGVKLDAQNLMEPIEIKGSENTSFVYDLITVLNNIKLTQDSIELVYNDVYSTGGSDSLVRALANEYQGLEEKKIQVLKNSIIENSSLAALLFIDQLDINEYSDVYIKLDEALYEKYPNNTFVINTHERVQKLKRLMPGNAYIEIALTDTSNQIVKLSQFEGKVILIDFWAAWCRPCREESPNMVRMYNRFNEKGFEIFGVSLDNKKSDWIKAIRNDGLTWTHVSDLRGWQSSAASEYGVKSIPHTVLIGRDGKIIATGLRGPALERKLEEIFEE